jgi:phage terminase small subunit
VVQGGSATAIIGQGGKAETPLTLICGLQRQISKKYFGELMKAPPRNLKKAAKEMWNQLRADFELDDGAGLALLRCACEAFQRSQEARALIDKEGACIVDRFGQRKPHPAISIERDSRGQLIAALRALKLEPGE